MNPEQLVAASASERIATALTSDAPWVDIRSSEDPRHHSRIQLLLAWPQTSSTTVGVLEFLPEDRAQPHCHSAEEVLYVL